jgi:DNA-binding CsgD family transcriptional regulator
METKASFSKSILQCHVEGISKASSRQEIFNLCSNITDYFEASYFTYMLLQPNDFHNLKYEIVSNINVNWANKYEEALYFQVDPYVRECIQSFTPVFWNTQKYDFNQLTTKAKTMIEDAHLHGLRAGVLIPVFDCRGINGVFGLGLDVDLYNSQSQKHLEQLVPYISYLGMFIHQTMIKIFEPEESEQKESLTKREKDCLCWAADGKTASEIGSKLYISENTVKFHSKNILKKLGARNMAQALAIGILNGVIKPVIE